MGETDGETPEGEGQSIETEDRSTPGVDTLKVPAGKRRKIKSPTPGEIRGRSATPIRGRSQTPFTLYLNRRSATPSGTVWRSITPFLKREEKEKTPFELGKDIKAQLICNKMVFDKALVMDISEPEVEPVRYLTSDMSVIDRAAVMDVSNVEVIYVVEEYEEEEIEMEKEEEEEVVVKKKKPRGGRKPKASSVEKRSSESPTADHEQSPSPGPSPAKEKKPKKKVEKKEKHEKSPSPKLSLKLELGGGPKVGKKMFDQPPPPAPEAKPPPKKAGKSKLALQMEEQAKAAAKAAEEAAQREAEKPKKETFEERQKRLKAEAEEQARLEEEQRQLEAELAAEEAAAENEEGDEEVEGEDGDDGEDGEDDGDEADDASQREPDDEDNDDEDDQNEEKQNEEEPKGKANDRRRSSASSADDFTRPDPDEERWKQIAEEEGQEFAEKLRKFSRVQHVKKSEKERDADWQRRREQARLPAFINFLTDRAAEEGQSVRLACAVTGPELSTKWFKDGKQLEPGVRHRIINNNNILSLQIMNCEMMDSGEYSCVIKNSNDEVISTCIVTIYQVFKDEPSPPTFSLIRDFYHLHDDELTIECHIHGIPRPKVTWIKGNFDIKPSFKFTMLEEAHGVYKLLIYRPSSKDSGKYICKAVNTSGEQEISHIIEFTKPKHFHAHGLHHANNLIAKSIEAEARKAMDDALKSKAESDSKRQPAPARTRTVDEPLVPPKQKLKFATQLRDRIALEKATVKLICNIIGPNPAVKWLKDDNPLQWGPKIKNLSSEGKAVLELNDVGPSSSGVYKLIAKNEFNEIDTSCYLKIYNPQTEGDESEPMFALPIKDIYHSSENALIISTKVRGNPRPTIAWLKDELPVVADIRTEQIEHLDGICELIINKPTQRENSGVYTCVAENKLGSVKSSHTVVIDNLPTSRRSSNTMSMGAASDEDVGDKPPSSKREESTTGSIGGGDGLAKPPSKKEKKEKKGESASETYERRRVPMPDPSLKEKLYFIVNMTNRYLPEGSRCKMQAVIGGPDPQIKWLKNGQPVVYGPKIRNMSNSGMAILEFLNATTDDSGEYTLICRNQANEITTTGILHIYEPKVNSDVEPVFTRALKDTYHLNSNELILESHVRGQPAPIVQWFKDSAEIKSNEKYQITELPDGTCELVIDKPNKNDTGKYVCKAENRVGQCEISHVVLFESQPTHIAENIHGVFHADKSVLKKTRDTEILEPEKSEAGDTNSVSSKGKGKGKGKPPSSKEETPSAKEATPAAKEPEKPIKEEKREKRIGIYFAAKLSDRVIAEGSRVKLSCYVQSPDPQVRWFKDDQPVVYGPKTKQMLMQGLCTLELPNASIEDSGNYRCFAKDQTGEITTTCKITVYTSPGSGDVPPTFTRSIKDTYRHKMNELVLDVHVRGLPTPTVTWVKDGVKLEPSTKYQMTEHDDGTCELFISDPLPRDGGKYICKAENRADEAEIVHIVHVDARNLRPISPVREPAEEKEDTKEASTRDVSKTREGSKATDSKPPTREGSKVQEDSKEGEGEEKKEKKGKKKQEVEYAGRREPPPPPDTKRMLHFGNFLSNRTVAEGSTVRMSVYIGGPDPQCRWFKGEQPIIFTPKTKMACQDNLAVLILSQLTEEDTDEYKLVARGTENTIETSCRVIVYQIAKEQSTAPVFTVGIKDIYSLNEDELILDCRVRGNPRPTIKWTKDSEPITNNEKYSQLDQADGYCKLIISKPTAKDSGVYVCEAENSVQAEKISHEVVFAGQERFIQEKTHGFFHRDPNKPHFLSSLGNHIVTLGGTIAIQAEFAQTNSEINVQWFKDKQPLPKLPSIKKFVERGIYTLAIADASPDYDGYYTCRAINDFGKAESSANVHISTDAGKSKMVIFLSRPEPEMKIAVGDPFSISFRVQGDPKPKLTLMKGTKDITRSDRVSKEGSDDYTRFTIHNSTLADSGTYFVVARNEVSTDRIFVTVTVKHPKNK